MQDNRIEILKKLENGEISAQDALGMLNQQPPEKQREAFHVHEPSSRHNEEPRSRVDEQGNFIEGVFGWVGDLLNDIGDGIRDMDIGSNVSDFVGGVYGHHKGRQIFSAEVSQDIKGLTLVGKNAKLEIRGYGGSEIRIECSYDARRPDPEIYFHEENGHYKLIYDEKIMRYFKILCEVPRNRIGEALLATKNDKVAVGGVIADKLMISTKNANVRLEEVSAAELVVQTRNDNIKVKRIETGNIHLETTNGNITAEVLSGDAACFKTSNASIKTVACNVTHMRLATSNAGLKIGVDEDEYWSGERTIEATTSNGGISFQASADVGLRIDAKTTAGKINCDRDNLSFLEFSKSRVVGESIGYDSMSRKINITLSTTNSGVKIRES